MLTSETYKREKRRLAIARGRFERARRAAEEWPNPYARELEGKGLAEIQAAIDSARKLDTVAREGLATFEEQGYPDAWIRWENARDDARSFIGRYELSPIGTV